MRRHSIVVVFFVLALTTLGIAAEDPANVAGTWYFSASVANGSVQQTFVIKQEGTKISGTFAPQSRFIGAGPLQGTVEGKKISFQVTTSRGLDGYEGTVDGETMKGTVTIGKDTKPVAWTAKRTR
jgi:hypothetical protein